MSDVIIRKQAPAPSLSIPARSKRLLWFGVFVVVVLIGLVFAVAYHSIAKIRNDMEEEIAERQKTIAASRAETVDAWLEFLAEHGKRLVTSDLFTLYASEVNKLPADVPFFPPSAQQADPDEEDEDEDRQASQVRQLASQLPLMRNQLTDFIAHAGFVAACIVNSRGEAYITTSVAPPLLGGAQKRRIAEAMATGKVLYAPLEMQQEGLILDIYMPIMAPLYSQESNKPVGVLIMSQKMDRKLAEFLSPGLVNEKGRRLKLIQKNDDIYQSVSIGATPLRQVTTFTEPKDNFLPFALRKSFGENSSVYSSGFRLRFADWWLVVEHDASLVQNSLATRAKEIYMLAGLISVALVLLISAVWWRLVGQEQCVINAEISNLLSVIEDQKKLLDGINSTMTDPISLTDEQGIFRYVNNAFALAVGRKAGDIVGLDGPAVFGFDTARRLNASDQHVLMAGENISITEVLWLQSKRYNFQISKTPLRESGGRTVKGIVSVFRDITQLVETQERSRRVVQQTIDALVSAIEEADPFLGGHSRIMGSIASLVARQLRLSEEDVATVEAAANLSQIGKMFVPRDILLKPGILTPQEKQEMEYHVEYARNVLKGIEFDLPVLEAIYQMNERLDGGGYPRGLAGDAVSMHARVLAVANAFTAMAKPRSYRAALPLDEVMSILEQHSDSYDRNVVAALKEVIASPAGERVVAQAAAAKAV